MSTIEWSLIVFLVLAPVVLFSISLFFRKDSDDFDLEFIAYAGWAAIFLSIVVAFKVESHMPIEYEWTSSVPYSGCPGTPDIQVRKIHWVADLLAALLTFSCYLALEAYLFSIIKRVTQGLNGPK